MSGSHNVNYSDDMKATGAALSRQPAAPGTSMNELIDRAFREPYYRFLLFLAALWRHWYWVLPFSIILGGLLGGLTYFITEEQYSSEAWVRIYMEQPYIAFPQQHSREEAIAIVLASLQILRSPKIVENAWLRIGEKATTEGVDISNITKKKDPKKWLRSKIKITQQAESPLYIVSFTTTNPRLSYLILDSIMSCYFKAMDEDYKKRSNGIIESLQGIADEKKIEIDALNREYNRLAREIATEGGDLPSELSKMIVSTTQTPLAMSIASLEAEIAAEEIMIKLNRNVLEDESEIPDSEVEGDLFQYPTMLQLLKEKADLQIRLEERMQKYDSEDARQVRQIQDKLDILEKSIEKATTELLPDMKKYWRASLRQQAHREILLSEQKVEQMKKQIESLQASNVKSQTKDANTVEIVNKAIETLTTRNREEEVFGKLLQRVGMLKTEKDAREQVDLISPASVPQFPDSSQRLRQGILVFILGFFAPVLLAWGTELLRPRFYHMSQFPIMFPGVSRETVAGMPRSGREASMSKSQKQAFYFSVDEIGNNLCFGRSFVGNRVFLFSSVCNDDGQTLLALSVAEKIALMRQKPVLLIDTHGDSARLRNLVGVESKASLADVLAMRLSINEAIVRDSQQPNLFFLPDGPSQHNSAIDLLSDGKFEMLLRELRNHYCAIIISAQPMERSSGAHVLCHYADAVVVALRLYDTPRKNTERLYERLFEVGKPINSFMISGVSAGK